MQTEKEFKELAQAWNIEKYTKEIATRIQEKIVIIETIESTRGDDLDIGKINGLNCALNIISDFMYEELNNAK